MKKLMIWFGLSILLAATAYGGSYPFTNPPVDTSTGYVFVVGNPTMVDAYWTIFNAMAALFQDDNYIGLLKLVFTMGGFFVFFSGIIKSISSQGSPSSSLHAFFSYMIVGMALLMILFSRSTTLFITTNNIATYCSTGSHLNESGSSDAHVDNIPTLLAFGITFFNRIGQETTKMATIAFSEPTGNVNMIRLGGEFGSYLEGIQSLSSVTVKDLTANVSADDSFTLGPFYSAFLKDCVVSPGVTDPIYGSQVIGAMDTTGDYLRTIYSIFEDAEICTYKSAFDPTGTCVAGIAGVAGGIELNGVDINAFYMTLGQTGTYRCGEAWTKIKATVTTVQTLGEIFCGHTLKDSMDGLTMYTLTGDATNGGSVPTIETKQVVMNSALLNSYKESKGSMGLGSSLGYAQGKTQAEYVANNLGTGYYMAKMIPYLQMGMRAVLYAFFPFVFVIVLLPGGIGVLMSYMQSLIWIELWAPTAAILNFFLMTVSKSKIKDIYEGTGMNVAASYQLMSDSAMLASVGGYLYASVPALTWLILKGSGQMLGGITSSMAGGLSKNLDSASFAKDQQDLTSYQETNKGLSAQGKDIMSMGEQQNQAAKFAAYGESGQFLGNEMLQANIGGSGMVLGAAGKTLSSGARDYGSAKSYLSDQNSSVNALAAKGSQEAQREVSAMKAVLKDRGLDLSSMDAGNEDDINKVIAAGQKSGVAISSGDAKKVIAAKAELDTYRKGHSWTEGKSDQEVVDMLSSDHGKQMGINEMFKEDAASRILSREGVVSTAIDDKQEFADEWNELHNLSGDDKIKASQVDDHGDGQSFSYGGVTAQKGAYMRDDDSGEFHTTETSIAKGLSVSRGEADQKAAEALAKRDTTYSEKQMVANAAQQTKVGDTAGDYDKNRDALNYMAKTEATKAANSSGEEQKQHLKNAAGFSTLAKKLDGHNNADALGKSHEIMKSIGAAGGVMSSMKSDAVAKQLSDIGVTPDDVATNEVGAFVNKVAVGNEMYDELSQSKEGSEAMEKSAEAFGLKEQYNNGTLSNVQKSNIAATALGTEGVKEQVFKTESGREKVAATIAAGLSAKDVGQMDAGANIAKAAKGAAMYDALTDEKSQGPKAAASFKKNMEEMGTSLGWGKKDKDGNMTFTDAQKTALATTALEEQKAAPEAYKGTSEAGTTKMLTENGYSAQDMSNTDALRQATSAEFANGVLSTMGLKAGAKTRAASQALAEVSSAFRNVKNMTGGPGGIKGAQAYLKKIGSNNDKVASLEKKIAAMGSNGRHTAAGLKLTKELRQVQASSQRMTTAAKALSALSKNPADKKALKALTSAIGSSTRAQAVRAAVTAGSITAGMSIGVIAMAGSEIASNASIVNDTRLMHSSHHLQKLSTSDDSGAGTKPINLDGREMSVHKVGTDQYTMSIKDGDSEERVVELKGMTDEIASKSNVLSSGSAYKFAAGSSDEDIGEDFADVLKNGEGLAYAANKSEEIVGDAAGGSSNFMKKMGKYGSDLMDGGFHEWGK